MHVRERGASVKNCDGISDVTDALTALNERYRASLPEKCCAISAAFSAWRANLAELEHLRELNRLLHKLAGSAGGYGYARLGEAARTADGLLHEWLRDAPDDLAERHALALTIEPLLRAIADLFAAAGGFDGGSALGGSAGPTGRKIQVVLVDDDGELSRMLSEQLLCEGIEVRCTEDGAGMHRLLSETRPDVLVLDFWLRDETGDTLARSVRGIPELSGLPAICLTTDRSSETRQRAIGAGALEVIDKSTPPRQLASLLRMFATRAA